MVLHHLHLKTTCNTAGAQLAVEKPGNDAAQVTELQPESVDELGESTVHEEPGSSSAEVHRKIKTVFQSSKQCLVFVTLSCSLCSYSFVTTFCRKMLTWTPYYQDSSLSLVNPRCEVLAYSICGLFLSQLHQIGLTMAADAPIFYIRLLCEQQVVTCL